MIAEEREIDEYKNIVQLSAVELTQRIRCKKLSCVQVMKAFLNQISKYNRIVNAIVSLVDYDDLLSQAVKLDEQLDENLSGIADMKLYGLPIAPKDLTATADLPTTCGSLILKDSMIGYDSIIVERFRKAGCIIIGKTNVPEFGLGCQTYNNVFGTTLNAYDITKTCGGSSGGAAVSLALNMLPIADGSDFGGSLRNPAAWNNIYGFRPSRGRVPSLGSSNLFEEQLSTEGPMARSVQDLGLLLHVMSGYDERSPHSLTESNQLFLEPLDHDFSNSKIGWLGNFSGYLPIENELMESSKLSLDYFRQLGMIIEDVSMTFNMSELWTKCWLKIRAQSIGCSLKEFYDNQQLRQQLKPEVIWEIEQSLSLTSDDIIEAKHIQESWTIEISNLLDNYDYLVLPSTQVLPFDSSIHWPKIIEGIHMTSYHRWMEVTIGATLAGIPAMSIPAGFHQVSHLPFGLQVLAKHRNDFSLLQLGYAWEKITPFKNMKSDILST